MMTFYAHAYLSSLPAGDRQRLFATHTPLGLHPETGDELLLEDRDRYAGMYVLGVQGTGKSGLLENLITRDANAKSAVICIDPHGDLIAHCLAALDAEHLTRTYLLDMEDEAYPFGANVFATGQLTTDMQRSQAVDRIMHVFEVLWADVLNQQHLPRYVRAATITLLSNPGATLVDMLAFLLDPDVRHRMLASVTDPTVRLFWQTQYDNLSTAEQSRRVQPLINRLEALFMGRSLVSNIVGQRRTTINFRRAIEQRQLIFIKLPIKTVTQDARLIGTILLSQLYAAVFSFGDLPESQRPGVSIYVDEFQHFATPDFASLFTEGRKFGVRLTLAHQYRDQLPGFLQQSTMTARTKVVFRTIAADASELAHEFPAQAGEFEPSPRATKELLTRTSDFPPAVREFVETYLRHLPRSGGEVDIHLGMGIGDYLWRDGKQPKPIKKPNPIGPLDSLLYEVMTTGNPHLPIPENAVYGLANGGVGFWNAIGSTNTRVLSQEAWDFPHHLVAPDPGGNPVWTRRPESPKEQLLHCLFHIRMTMHHLAQHPVGKQSTSSSNVASMLTQLPARCAFVKSDKAVGTIFTHDTPGRVTGWALDERVQFIRENTREAYCHPRSEVEVAPAPPHNDPEPATVSLRHASEGEFHVRSHAHTTQETPRSRWEEINE